MLATSGRVPAHRMSRRPERVQSESPWDAGSPASYLQALHLQIANNLTLRQCPLGGLPHCLGNDLRYKRRSKAGPNRLSWISGFSERIMRHASVLTDQAPQDASRGGALAQSDTFGLVGLAVLVGFVAALGAAPHAAFSNAVGEPAFFKGAYDEDTYVILLLKLEWIPQRL